MLCSSDGDGCVGIHLRRGGRASCRSAQFVSAMAGWTKPGLGLWNIMPPIHAS